MRRHDDSAQQTAYEAWNDTVLNQADHRIDCQDGCTILGDVCPTGQAYASSEQLAWKLYHDVRRAEVTA